MQKIESGFQRTVQLLKALTPVNAALYEAYRSCLQERNAAFTRASADVAQILRTVPQS